ncbi:MAG: amidohydrolase family protein, partial [Planctomycetes bacterium]|nr:amidohydrolase family protein [Planctomycetota bacterium]
MIIRNGLIITMDDDGRIFEGDLRIDDGNIVEMASYIGHAGTAEDVLDARGCLVLPGFVQAHVHLCQTLCRNTADDLELLDWLAERVWPHEAALTPATLRAAADLGLLELIDGGTSTILDMGTVHHTDVLFEAARDAGIRYAGGKCLMDLDESGRCPERLIEEPKTAMAETAALAERWHGAAGGRLRYAVAPRFAVSCSEELLELAGDFACAEGLLIHTHASENLGECEIIRRRTGRDNVDYLSDLGLLGSHVVLAHGVHLSEA